MSFTVQIFLIVHPIPKIHQEKQGKQGNYTGMITSVEEDKPRIKYIER
jgi:hypothetical protein